MCPSWIQDRVTVSWWQRSSPPDLKQPSWEPGVPKCVHIKTLTSLKVLTLCIHHKDEEMCFNTGMAETGDITMLSEEHQEVSVGEN